VSHRRRAPSAAEGGRADWLGRPASARGRTWALEEQLFGTASVRARGEVLEVLTADLAGEKAELSRLEEELHDQVARVAKLEWRVRVLKGSEPPPAATGMPRGEKTELVSRPSPSSLERDYWLCRCEGFWVDSPAGRIGLVDGLRFLSRIDQPDLLEVRGGALGRRLLLVPTDQVDQILFSEGRLVLREAPPFRRDHLVELVSRLYRRQPATA